MHNPQPPSCACELSAIACSESSTASHSATLPACRGAFCWRVRGTSATGERLPGDAHRSSAVLVVVDPWFADPPLCIAVWAHRPDRLCDPEPVGPGTASDLADERDRGSVG